MTMTVCVPCNLGHTHTHTNTHTHTHTHTHTQLHLPDAFVRLYQDYQYVREDVGTASVCAVVDAGQVVAFEFHVNFVVTTDSASKWLGINPPVSYPSTFS